MSCEVIFSSTKGYWIISLVDTEYYEVGHAQVSSSRLATVVELKKLKKREDWDKAVAIAIDGMGLMPNGLIGDREVADDTYEGSIVKTSLGMMVAFASSRACVVCPGNLATMPRKCIVARLLKRGLDSGLRGLIFNGLEDPLSHSFTLSRVGNLMQRIQQLHSSGMFLGGIIPSMTYYEVETDRIVILDGTDDEDEEAEAFVTRFNLSDEPRSSKDVKMLILTMATISLRREISLNELEHYVIVKDGIKRVDQVNPDEVGCLLSRLYGTANAMSAMSLLEDNQRVISQAIPPPIRSTRFDDAEDALKSIGANASAVLDRVPEPSEISSTQMGSKLTNALKAYGSKSDLVNDDD